MTAKNKFKATVIRWLCNHGFPNVDIGFKEDFGYAIDNYTNMINIGVEANPEVGKYFEQFLYEFGLEYVGIPLPVLVFFHELGHHMTLSSFSSDELWLCSFAKNWSHGEIDQEWYFNYWNTMDEFAANAWEIDYINSHIEAVEEFCNMIIIAWSELCQEVNPFSLIKEDN